MSERLSETLPSQLVGEFVIAAHRSLSKVRTMLVHTPALLKVRVVVSGSVVIDPRLDSESALQAAVHMGNRDIAMFLLDEGEDADLGAASMLGMVRSVEKALRANPALIRSKGAHGIPMLYIIAVGGSVDVADLFVARGADLEQRYAGYTVLHTAARCGHAALVAYLVERGAEVTARDFNGRTPAMLASDSGYPSIERMLRASSKELRTHVTDSYSA